jgi:hypothetical protein
MDAKVSTKTKTKTVPVQNLFRYISKLLVSNGPVTCNTLESGIDLGQGINVGPGKFDKNNKRRALNKHRAWKISKKE